MKRKIKNFFTNIWPINSLIVFLWKIKVLMKLPEHAYDYETDIADLQMAYAELMAPGNMEKLDFLADTHKGDRCFIIGNGPSLSASDLNMLKANSEYCFGSNRIYKIFDQTDWRPDVWMVADYEYVLRFSDEFELLGNVIRVVPCSTLIGICKKVKDAIYIPMNRSTRVPFTFNKDIRLGTREYFTITLMLVNMAVYMGFTEIYLLGVDNNLPLIKNNDGTVHIDLSKKSHFHHEYTRDSHHNIAISPKFFNYRNQAYRDIKLCCEELGVKIYNATRGGELEVYDRVNLDDVLSKTPNV